MKYKFTIIIVASGLMASAYLSDCRVSAQNTSPQPSGEASGTFLPTVSHTGAHLHGSSPLFVTNIPEGYREWRLISVAREEGALDDIRAILGNDVAFRAYREGKLPLPDGAILARLAWTYLPSDENNKAFGRTQSFVAGPPKNGVQFMVKDATKYASTGGWGYGQFDNGEPANVVTMQSCFPCHQAVAERDFVFALYAP